MSVNPPRPKGPPLNALRAFEAAARLGGFAQAAEELCVTPGAISQHIKTLEDWLGAPLFHRRSQGVRLTDFGQTVLPGLTDAFDALGGAVQQMRALSGRQTVQIAALPSVAQLWLSPRLPAIRAALPDVAISVTALENPPNLSREPFDLSLFLRCPDGRPGEVILAEDRIYPVCAPEMAQQLSGPRDLVDHPLIHDAVWGQDWATWARAALGDEAGFDRGARHTLYAIAMEEAQNGAGALIGHECLVQRSLSRGALVAPFGPQVPSGLSLVLEHAAIGPLSRAVRDVMSHLRAG